MSNTISWSDMAPYVTPPVAAGMSIVPVFGDMIAKSAQQLNKPVPKLSIVSALKEGCRVAPTVGAIVGTQMVLQQQIERQLNEGGEGDLKTKLVSSATVGALSSPVLAVFNGQSLGWGVLQSIRRFTPKQAGAITAQETAFVLGLSAADEVASVMKSHFGEHRAVDDGAAFISGAMGSLAGHPANTALTRWQQGLAVDSFRQSMWGAMRKARCVGCFALLYKWGKELSA